MLQNYDSPILFHLPLLPIHPSVSTRPSRPYSPLPSLFTPPLPTHPSPPYSHLPPYSPLPLYSTLPSLFTPPLPTHTSLPTHLSPPYSPLPSLLASPLPTHPSPSFSPLPPCSPLPSLLTPAARVQPHVALGERAEAGQPAHRLVGGGVSHGVAPRLAFLHRLHHHLVDSVRLAAAARVAALEAGALLTDA